MAPEKKRALSRTESELFVTRRRRGTLPPSAAAGAPPVAISPAAEESPPDPLVAPSREASGTPPATFVPSPSAAEAAPAQIAPSPAAAAAEARSAQIAPSAAEAADATPAHVAPSPSAGTNGAVPASNSISVKRALSLTEAELFVARRRRGTRATSSPAAEAPPAAPSPSAAEVPRAPPVSPSPAAAEAPPAQIAPSPAAAAAAAAESRRVQIAPSASTAAAASGATPSPVTLSSSAESNVAVPAVNSISDLRAAASSDMVKGLPPEYIAAAAPPARQHGYSGRIGSLKSFRKICDLGVGGYGVVSKARDARTGHVVAIKSSRHPGDGAALLREAALLVACRGNPAVVELREVVRGPGEDDFHLVMDFIGRSLHDAIFQRRRNGQRFTELETLRLMRELLTGVAVMREHGVVHCDLKPENILVGKQDGHLKICDFGLASSDAAPPRDFQGTLWYSAPEQLLCEGNCGPAVDSWALGCIMAELLTGEPLIEGLETAHQLTSIIYLLGVSDEVSKMTLGVDASARSELRDMVPEKLLSSAGFDVLQGLLRFDPTERLTPAAALSMEWFHGTS